ncbi:MAG: ABC transporter substrate-binding protein [Oscillospiraceae bacterium]|nr:ABC transporter substrate-binding protein [Oscillospiraceae bacterium]
MKKHHRILSLILIAILLLSLTACGAKDTPASTPTPAATPGQSAQPAPPEGGDQPEAPASTRDTLNIAVTGDSGSINPKNPIWGDFGAIANMYAEKLWDVDNEGIKWILATGVDYISDVLWTIHLRENVYFSNGNPFTAEDVFFSWKEVDSGLFPWCPAANFPESKIIDDYTIELHLNNWDIGVMNSLSLYPMFDHSTYDALEYEFNPIGTGPYLLQTYVINSHVYLEANPNYWGNPPAIKNLKFYVNSEPAQRVTALQTGVVDVAAVPNSEVSFIESLPEYKTFLRNSSFATAVFFNLTSNSEMSNIDARYAVAYSVDREAIKTLVFDGLASIPTWACSNDVSDFDPRLEYPNELYRTGYDPELAKQYAEKAGLVDGQELRIVTDGTTENATIAEILQYNLGQIGIKAVINNYDAASFLSVIGDPTMSDIYIYVLGSPARTAATGLHGAINLSPVFLEGGWAGYDFFVDKVQEKISNIFDDNERMNLVLELNKYVSDDLLFYSFVTPQSAMVCNASLGGVEFIPSPGANTYYNEWYWIS